MEEEQFANALKKSSLGLVDERSEVSGNQPFFSAFTICHNLVSGGGTAVEHVPREEKLRGRGFLPRIFSSSFLSHLRINR